MNKNIRKLIILGVISISTLSFNPITVHAEWRQDSNGWWNTEGGSWSVGWRQIDGKWYYFDTNGYMKTNWLKDNENWYYLKDNGSMAINEIINGYNIGNNGVWIQNTNVENNSNNINISNQNSNNVTNNSNNSVNSNNISNLTNNINNGVIINGNVVIDSVSNSNNNQFDSDDGDKTEPIIEGKFTDKENAIFPCWTIIEGKYYHLDSDKQIDYNTIIDGYKIGSDGAWTQDNLINPPKAILLPYGFTLNAKQVIQKLQMETRQDNVRQSLKNEKHQYRMEKIEDLENKINDLKEHPKNNGDYWIQIYQNKIKELQLEDQNN